MTTAFEKYGDILFDAWMIDQRQVNHTDKNPHLLVDIFQYYQLMPRSILFVGFSPWMLTVKSAEIFVTEVGSEVTALLAVCDIEFTLVDLTELMPKQFDVVVAVDEYFTFAETDQEQQEKVALLSSMAQECLVTTLRDYKNQVTKDREFSYPVAIKDGNSQKIFFEQYEYSPSDHNAIISTSYAIDQSGVAVIGPFDRRTMYFKQLAKWTIDAGAKKFLVHKELAYKNIIKKTYEHVITVRF